MVSLLQVLSFVSLCLGKAAVLDKETLAPFLKDNENVLVKFYAPWCGHCKRMAPEFDDAAERLKDTTALAKIDVDEEKNKPLMGEYGISGFPTLKFFHNGKAMDYDGGRTADEIVEWIQKITGPVIDVVEDKAAGLAAHEGSAILAYCGSMEESEDTYKVFKEAAEDNRGKFVYIGYKCSSPKVELVRKDGTTVDVEDVSDAETLIDYAHKNRLSYFEPIGPDNARDYFESGLKIVFFGGTTADYEKVSEVASEVAKNVRDTHLFTFIDTDKWQQQAEGMMRTTVFPSFVVPEEVGMYQFTDADNFTVAGLGGWMEKVISGELTPELQSEPIPETNDDAVKVIVGKSFEDVVADDKDVMVEVMASWCGVCKQFKPVYEEFAEKMQALSPTTIIGAIDGSVNEIPVLGYPFTGFPTIFFKKAGGEPELYSGERTLEALLEYVKTNGTNTFNEDAGDKDEL